MIQIMMIMEKFIGKIFYYTYRMLYPRYGRNPFYAYTHISLFTWIIISTIALSITIHIIHIGVNNIHYKTIVNITCITCFILTFSYNYWVIYYKKKYRDIILSNKAKSWQCILYALLYNGVLPIILLCLIL